MLRPLFRQSSVRRGRLPSLPIVISRGCSTEDPSRRVAAFRVAELRRRLQAEAAGPGAKVNAEWIPGLLKSPAGGTPARLAPGMAAELLFEVGWNARHRYLDVREHADGGKVPGALHCPFLPEAHSFEARASDALRGDGGGIPKAARVIVGCDGSEDSEDAQAAVTILQRAGYVNAVVLDGGFERWRTEGLPVEKEEEMIPDSTL